MNSEGGQVKYDVFLSFRGEDTRDNFIDHLYHALRAAHIHTFLDDRKIETGDELKPELEAGIRRSKASIIVISKNYATSTWCLNELALILEEKEKDKNRIVIPIFYHVDPSDVRKLQGSFGDAMHKHRMNIEAEETGPPKKRQRIEHFERWKAALEEVANLKGKVVKGSEYNFIKEIVREISERLGRKASITNLPLLIGRNDLVGQINSWLADGSSNAAHVLTICGIAGIGKTTLARYIYLSNVGQRFDGGSFLQDIGSRASQPNIMLKLQKKLLRDIGTGSQEISDVARCTDIIQKALKDKKLFLVLDDVNDVEHLNSLLGNGGFQPGTKVIITTNKMSLPQKIKKLHNRDNIQSNYNNEVRLLEGLSEDASLELLCQHAFESSCPKGFEKLSREVVAYCGGHPLALRVLGENLFELQLHIPRWEDTLKKLKTEFNSKIRRALQLSFDLFEYESDKEVFKDVACFLVGEERNCVETILDAPSGIQNLITYGLLTVDPLSNYLKMARLIREMGRDMVRRGLKTNPSDESKLWCHEDCLNVLRQRKIIEVAGDIKCFILDMKKLNQDISSKVNLKTDAVKQMRSLELLKLNFVTLDGSYREFPPNLNWLCWHGFPLETIPPELPMTALVALDMSHSKLQLWELPQELSILKILDFSWSSELSRIANFSKLPKLERLILRGCTSLVEVDESIGDLGGVLFVDMSGCKSLINLPNSLPKLKLLKTLLLSGCANQDEVMATSPRSLGPNYFPHDFSRLTSLEKLDLSYTNIPVLPDCVTNLSGIKTLYVQSCEHLESLCLPSTIVELNVRQCKSLKKVTFKPDTPKELRLVDKSQCDQLTEVQGFFKVDSVEEFEQKIVKSLRWCDFSKLILVRDLVTGVPNRVPAEVVYEFGIFSTWFLGEKVPDWFHHCHKSEKASISFTVPSPPMNHRIEGLNVCSAHIVRCELPQKSSGRVKINNMTKNLTWIYEASGWVNGELPPEWLYEDMVLLTHWRFGNQLEEHDEVTVSMSHDNHDEVIKEVCINFVFASDASKEDEEIRDPLKYYSSSCWKHIIGRNLGQYQLPTGEFYLKSQRLLA